MPHDPNACPRCRWAAERLKAVKLSDGEITRWIRKGQLIRSFCTHLDAVAGLMKKIGTKFKLCYSPSARMWIYASAHPMVRIQRVFRSPEDLPAACVIEAAMQVLVKEESDG